MGNSWMLESKGWIWSGGMDPELFEALQVLPKGVSVSVRHYSRDGWAGTNGQSFIKCQTLPNPDRLLVDFI